MVATVVPRRVRRPAISARGSGGGFAAAAGWPIFTFDLTMKLYRAFRGLGQNQEGRVMSALGNICVLAGRGGLPATMRGRNLSGRRPVGGGRLPMGTFRHRFAASSRLPGTFRRLPETSSRLPGTSSRLSGSFGRLSGTSSRLPGTSGRLPETSGRLSGTSSRLPETSGRLSGTSGQADICLKTRHFT
jgi:hypothetical protein